MKNYETTCEIETKAGNCGHNCPVFDRGDCERKVEIIKKACEFDPLLWYLFCAEGKITYNDLQHWEK